MGPGDLNSSPDAYAVAVSTLPLTHLLSFQFFVFNFFQSQWVWGGFLLWFWFAFLLSLIMFHLFLCILIICIFSLERVYSNPLPILKASCLSFCCWLVRVLCFVRFRVEAKKTHFSYGSSKMKAWFFSGRQPVQDLNCISRGSLYNIYIGWEDKGEGSGVGCCTDQSFLIQGIK